MVTAAWNTAISKSPLTVYNCCTGEKAPITWGRLVSLAIEKMRVHPLGEFLRKFLYKIIKCLIQWGLKLKIKAKIRFKNFLNLKLKFKQFQSIFRYLKNKNKFLNYLNYPYNHKMSPLRRKTLIKEYLINVFDAEHD
jgi:hypothetical protein